MTKCPKCGSTDIDTYKWESSDGAYEDMRYTCNTCKHVCWIDGPDA